MSDVKHAVGIFFSYAVLAIFAQNAVFTRGLGVSRLVQLVGDDRTNSWWFALLLCVIGSTAGPLYARPGGDPAQTVAKFYDAVLASDYPTAYSCLSDYTGLGLETELAGDNAVKIYAALRESYDYVLSGTAKVDGISAVQNVRFRYLDLSSLEASVEDGMQRNIEKAARDEPADQVYDENNKYLPAVAEKAYSDALTSVLSHASSYYTASVIEVELTYTDGQWLIVTNRDMLNALMGGAAY